VRKSYWKTQFWKERDRRYAEVKAAEEKALLVKETADKEALGLAREIQVYKDEKANELREQINSERGNYATNADLKAANEKQELALKPLQEYVTGEQSGGNRLHAAWVTVAGVISMALVAIAIIVDIILRSGTHGT
jgi:vacuolar-type H+-ATPase subunit H